jgi:predicted phosphatase
VYSDMDDLFRAQMEKKNIDLITTISENCPRKLFTDIGKLEQILKFFIECIEVYPEKERFLYAFHRFRP